MIKKHKSGAYKVTLPIYEVAFYVTTSLEVAKELTGKAYKGNFVGMVVSGRSGGEPPVLILLDTSYNTVAHECVHLTLEIMDWLGMRVTYEDQEPFAYLMGYITEQVYEVIARDS